MLFNSIEFLFFLPTVFIIYWFVLNRNLKLQNVFLILSSYLFYGWWDYRFLSLILISSVIDYCVGRGLLVYEKKSLRKLLLLLSIFANLGFLGFFKYYNFFAENFANAFTLLGKPFDVKTLNIILPVGISFYTFQTLSYSIDVYNRKITATKDFVSFLAFVSFFPQLVAGPIERARNLLPQFYSKRQFDLNIASDGMRQILWGLFKKMVIADNCAVYVNDIFTNYQAYSGMTLLAGGIFFAFQIYGDFSGYSDIAIGTARLFGFNLMQNFAFPYFSRDIAEFWRRWHISLSSWFKDYVYIPLGGSRGSKLLKARNVFAIFLISGFWHGANWTFIAWGLINALFFLPLQFMKRNRKNINVAAEGKLLPSIREVLQIGFTFFITVIAWVFFRADSISVALDMNAQIFKSIFSGRFLDISAVSFNLNTIYHSMLILFLLIIEWLQRDKLHALQIDQLNIPRFVRWSFYYIVLFLIFWFSGNQQDFIYFQF